MRRNSSFFLAHNRAEVNWSMNPGFISLWLIIIWLVLLATGWKPFLFPAVGRRTMLTYGMLSLLLIPNPVWLEAELAGIRIELHVAVCALLIAAMAAAMRFEGWSQRGYLVLSMVMIAVVWGSVRKMYSYDPVFYWLDPIWDAPLAAGVLCGAFSSEVRHQGVILLWGAAVSELLLVLLQTDNPFARIGSLSWWDGFLIAFSAARLVSILLRGARSAMSKAGTFFWHSRGGGSA